MADYCEFFNGPSEKHLETGPIEFEHVIGFLCSNDIECSKVESLLNVRMRLLIYWDWDQIGIDILYHVNGAKQTCFNYDKQGTLQIINLLQSNGVNVYLKHDIDPEEIYGFGSTFSSKKRTHYVHMSKTLELKKILHFIFLNANSN